MNLAKLGLGALNAAQYKLKTSAHNVNNAAVEGYNRQTVLTQTVRGQATGAGYIGRGVMAVTVERAYDDFLFRQYVSAKGEGAALSSYATEIEKVDTLLADRTVGISPALENFFKSVNAVASEPMDPAAREEMLGQANNLATQIRETNNFLEQQRGNINTQITTVVDQINSYLNRIHDANQQIMKARASASAHEPNDLLDQRDQLLNELNQLVGVKAFEQDGNLGLSIGNGQVVLSGSTVYPLQAQRSAADPERIVVGYTVRDSSGKEVPVELDENYIRGGKLGGLIEYRQEVLDDAQNNLGRMAVGLAYAFNQLHKEGVDLHGVDGTDFFKVNPPHVIPSNSSTVASVSVDFDDVKNLTADDYRVTVVDESGTLKYVVTNVTTKEEMGRYDVPANAADTTSDVIDGLKFTFTGGANVGDSWTIQPTRKSASTFQVVITDPAKIAAADKGAGVSNGDNALELAKLQYQKTLGGKDTGTNDASMSISEAFSQIVNRVGVLSQQNKTALKAQESLIQQTYAAQQQVSGVNLNEEYVNIEQYLEQFRAASRLIEVSNSMFETLLNMR